MRLLSYMIMTMIIAAKLIDWHAKGVRENGWIIRTKINQEQIQFETETEPKSKWMEKKERSQMNVKWSKLLRFFLSLQTG